MAGMPWRLSLTPGRIRRAAPGLGQYSAEVLEGFLGLTRDETGKLIDSGVTGTDPPR